MPIFTSHRVGHDCSSECSHEVGQTSIVFSYLKSKFLRSRPLVLAFRNVSTPARKVSNLPPANKTPEISVAKDFSFDRTPFNKQAKPFGLGHSEHVLLPVQAANSFLKVMS